MNKRSVQHLYIEQEVERNLTSQIWRFQRNRVVRHATIYKLLFMTALGISTAVITATFIRKGRASAEVSNPSRSTRIVSQLPRESVPLGGPAEPSIKTNEYTVIGKPIASNRLDDGIIHVIGNVVSVSARASVHDPEGDLARLWSVRVYDQSTNTKVSERPYLNNIFHTDAADNASPALDDQFELPPGSYRVMVVLYRVPANFDATILADDEAASPFVCLYSSESVIIPSR